MAFQAVERAVDRLGVAIVGTGIMARTHGAILESNPRSVLTCWLSRTGGNRDALRAISTAPVLQRLDDVLADDNTRAVLVATPDHAHREAAVAAAEAGRHVLIEKPLATTSADARAIRDAAAANGVVAMTLFNHRFVPSYWQAKQAIDERELGPLQVAYARKNDTRYVPTQMIDWADRTTPAWFLSCHDIDLLLWYAGERVERVFAREVTGTLRDLGIDTPDAIQAQLHFTNGGVATVEACWTYPDTFPSMTDSFVELVLRDAVIHLDRKHEQIEIADQKSFSYPRNTLASRIAGRPSGSTAVAVDHFIDCVLDKAEPLIDVAGSVHVTEVLEAIHESCRTGMPVRVEGS